MRLAAATFVVVDVETTGLRAEWDRVIEIAAVKVQGSRVVDRYEALIDLGRAIPGRITRLTGISTAMVFGKPPVEAIMPSFLDFLGDGVLVAHNLAFDQRFLAAELQRCGLPCVGTSGVCTLRLARRLLPALPSRGLGALARHFGVAHTARHRALGDAEATAAVFLRLLDRASANYGLTTVGELLAFQHRRYRSTSGEPAHLRMIREEVVPELPHRPGVYLFKRRNGEVLYVGKAKSLAERVRSYFAAIDHHPTRIRRLLRDVRVIEWEETGSELAALLRESYLIKHRQPRDNRAQTAYRDYPFIRLDTRERYPRLTAVLGLAADGAEYYGPISTRALADEVVALVDQHFGLRSCDEQALRLATSRRRPCLCHELEQCVAPCVHEDEGRYSMELARVRRLLAGDPSDLLAVLAQKMRAAAERLDFEQAARIRDQSHRLRAIAATQRPFGLPVLDVHGVLLEEDLRGGAQAFILRSGRLVDQVRIGDIGRSATAARLRSALERWFGAEVPRAPALSRSAVDEIKILSHWLRCAGVDGRFVAWRPGVLIEEMIGALETRWPAAPAAG